MANTTRAENVLVPYPIISAAVRGEPDAVNKVIQHYSRYITACSMRASYDAFGNETPALNALKALRGAPISMGRGEIPVELRPAAIRFLPLLFSDKSSAFLFTDNS